MTDPTARKSGDDLVIERMVEFFDPLTAADYERLCKEQVSQEAIVAECILSVQEAKTAVKPRHDTAQRRLDTIHDVIISGKERREIPCKIIFKWKEGIVEHWRKDREPEEHIKSMDRSITQEERATQLPISVMIKITGSVKSKSVLVAGKELVVLEAWREIPLSKEHFSWGDTSPETKQLAAAILLRFVQKVEAAKLVDKFVAQVLSIAPPTKDLSLALDMQRWLEENKTIEQSPKPNENTEPEGKNGEEKASSKPA